jgi:hypothetical protein
MTVCKFGSCEIEVENMIGTEGKEILHYRHPLTGLWSQSIDSILDDMNKYFEKKKTEWVHLTKYIKEDTNLSEKVSNGDREKEYI